MYWATTRVRFEANLAPAMAIARGRLIPTTASLANAAIRDDCRRAECPAYPAGGGLQGSVSIVVGFAWAGGQQGLHRPGPSQDAAARPHAYPARPQERGFRALAPDWAQGSSSRRPPAVAEARSPRAMGVCASASQRREPVPRNHRPLSRAQSDSPMPGQPAGQGDEAKAKKAGCVCARSGRLQPPAACGPAPLLAGDGRIGKHDFRVERVVGQVRPAIARDWRCTRRAVPCT